VVVVFGKHGKTRGVDTVAITVGFLHMKYPAAWGGMTGE